MLDFDVANFECGICVTRLRCYILSGTFPYLSSVIILGKLVTLLDRPIDVFMQ